MMISKEKDALPFLICSNMMVKSFPALHCDKDTLDVTDVLSKVKVLEDSVNGFMKQNNEQLQILTDTIANMKIPPSFSTLNRNDNSETPGSKKRKVHESETTTGQVDKVDGITSLSYAGAAKTNIQAPGHSNSFFQRQTQPPTVTTV